MRTTLTLDDDVAAKLEAEVRRSRRSYKETVNELLRTALAARKQSAAPPAFVIEPLNIELRPGISLDDIEGLLDQVEGPFRK